MLPEPVTGRKFDGAQHDLSHCMKAVDWILELPDRIYFIEVKDPDDPRAREHRERARFLRSFQSDKGPKEANRFIRSLVVKFWRRSSMSGPATGSTSRSAIVASDTLDAALSTDGTRAFKVAAGPGRSGRWISSRNKQRAPKWPAPRASTASRLTSCTGADRQSLVLRLGITHAVSIVAEVAQDLRDTFALGFTRGRHVVPDESGSYAACDATKSEVRFPDKFGYVCSSAIEPSKNNDTDDWSNASDRHVHAVSATSSVSSESRQALGSLPCVEVSFRPVDTSHIGHRCAHRSFRTESPESIKPWRLNL